MAQKLYVHKIEPFQKKLDSRTSLCSTLGAGGVGYVVVISNSLRNFGHY